MRNSTVVWAIIPARSGSKGLKNKNIADLNGAPLIAHTIEFALKSESFDKILLSTDSKKYAEIGKKFGAWVPFLRSKSASNDESMEEAILADLDRKLRNNEIPFPDVIVWLRPTFPFRSVIDLKKGLAALNHNIDSVRLVVPSEPRLYIEEDGFLTPYFRGINKSMVRRQDFPVTYSVYHTDIFWFKNVSLGEHFLGSKIKKVEISKICGIDIDSEEDFVIAEALMQSNNSSIIKYCSIPDF
jgi:CMP-N,N'-diacetyllegionaminic acid synthase